MIFVVTIPLLSVVVFGVMVVTRPLYKTCLLYTSEAIISEEVFQKVQELIASRRRKRRNGTDVYKRQADYPWGSY